jgi:hypothetical protein
MIDFQQVVSPQHNRNAYAIFERDLTRLCEDSIGQGLLLNPRRLAVYPWTAHGFRLRQEVHPRLPDADAPGNRRLWNRNEMLK